MNVLLKTALLVMLALVNVLPESQAAIEVYEFDSPEQERSFKRLADELRCPMCLNANLSGSDAPIAADLRREIYDQLQQGRSEQEIIEFMTARYGDFILYRPPLNTGTALLWFGPVILLLLGFLIARRIMKSSQQVATDDNLSQEEEQRLRKILHNDSEN